MPNVPQSVPLIVLNLMFVIIEITALLVTIY